MVGKEIGERDGFKAGKTGEIEVFAEGEGWKAVGGQASGEVAGSGIDPKKGRAGAGDGKAGKIVVEVFDEGLPSVEEVDFVEEEMGAAVGDVVFGDFVGFAVGEPDVVEGEVEGHGGRVKGLHALEEEGGLANAPRAEDGKQAGCPVHAVGERASEFGRRGGQTAFRDGVDAVKTGWVHGTSSRESDLFYGLYTI